MHIASIIETCNEDTFKVNYNSVILTKASSSTRCRSKTKKNIQAGIFKQRYYTGIAEAQAMIQVAVQVSKEAAKVEVHAMAAAKVDTGARLRSRAVRLGPRLGRPSLNQPSFTWSATDIYAELQTSGC